MDLELKGRTALVTGASQGLGRAIALALAAEGARVAMVARRAELLETLTQEIVSAGGARPVALQADLYPDDAGETIAARAIAALGHVEILINAAGGSRPLPLDAPKEAWYEGVTLNFFRLRELTHAVLPSMQKHGYGRVINLTGTREPRNLNAAHAAKAAVHVWSKGLSKVVAADGITINCIQPGKLRSEQIDKRWPTEEARREWAKKEVPMGRMGNPEELADLAVFLASARSSYITGNIIAFDGGARFFAF
ncbi:SDR family oxidoreductase [Verticiella sediminum]|uniref:SDR family oxidoreductase n=1 Tax=Verticiella sediminum TaxID=1247510 RepID=A0A556AJK2_9BURK|nr:SDR family oxidoreductase [Verticiella sediminum]TSH93088.1 SDR family oxidoreductase [Verticiella sediminum]